MSRSLDMTGFWVGQYSYDWPGEPVVSFIANIQEANCVLTGSIDEPNTVGFSSSRVNAFVRGHRADRNVRFAKVYDGASDLAHRVDYVGALSDDGLSLTGTWLLDDISGGFRMTREAVEEVASEEEAESLELASGLFAPVRSGFMKAE